MTTASPARRWRLLIGVVLVVVVVDQGTKALVRAYIPPGDAYTVLPGCFDFVHGQNTGIAFGLFRAVPDLFTLLGILTVPLLIWGYAALPLTAWGRVAWAGIVGGAIGNAIDRIRIGHVTDFIDWYVGPYHWYAFNLADASIVVGVFAIVGLNLLLPDPAPGPTSDVSDPV